MATVADMRKVLDDHADRQRGEVEVLKRMLKELTLELKLRGGSPRKVAPAAMSFGGTDGVDMLDKSTAVAKGRSEVSCALGLDEKSSVSKKTTGTTGISDDGGQVVVAVPEGDGDGKEEQHSDHTILESAKAARFNMAKALGFDSLAHSMDEKKKKQEEEAAEATLTPAESLNSKRSLTKKKSFISKRAMQNAMQDRSCFECFVRSSLFENLSGSIICINAIVIGVHANLRALHPGRCLDEWANVFLVFNTFFTLELLTRIGVYRREFLFSSDCRWNLFDTTIVCSGLLEEVITRALGHADCAVDADSGANFASGITALRILRVLRVVRIIKAFRTMTVFRELRVMVASTLGCLIPLSWACLLLCFIQWCFSVYFVHLATDHVSDGIRDFGIDVLDDPTKPYKDVRLYFGSLWLSIYTLFQSITGGLDWGRPVNALFEATGQYHPMVLYMAFIALTLFAVLNVITGVFVENATKIALRDRELIIQDALEERDHYKEDVLAVFREADLDGSGQLTVAEFETHLEDPRVQAFLQNLELDCMGAQRMFRLLDLDGNGMVSSTEFVTGCMCLKGDAKTIDVAALLLEVHKMSSMLSKSIVQLEGRLDAVSTLLVIGGDTAFNSAAV